MRLCKGYSSESFDVFPAFVDHMVGRRTKTTISFDPITYNVTMVVSDYCLPDSAWAAENWAEFAEQFGNIVELQS